MPRFVNLHNHSDYSLLRAASPVKKLAARAAELGMSHLAITDDGNLFGAIEFYNACKAHDVTPIIGCDFHIAAGNRHQKSGHESGNRTTRLVLLAKDQVGYANLLKLSSLGYTEGFYYRPRIDYELIEKYHEGLIALSGSISGDVPALILQNKDSEARQRALWYRDVFGEENFYFELGNHGLPEQNTLNRALIDLSTETGIPLVATNETYYVGKDDANAQDILLCIGSNRKKNEPGRFRFSTQEFYLKSPEQMEELFGEVPDAIENSVRIAEACTVELEFPGPEFPAYEIPAAFSDPSEYLRHITYEGLAKRYSPVTDTLRERVDYELDIIISMGFTGYFLIVWDFIRFARDQGIPVGPGRGSGAGSLVAYSLEITDIDPLQYSLLFERFLNPDRVSMPDFDIDFCFERRGEVIDYVNRKYGSDKVGQIITFGTLKTKAVIRDVARALDLPYAEADSIAKLVPNDLKITLPKALEQEPRLKEIQEKGGVYGELIETSLKLEGLHRHASTHAAGIVIGRKPLTEYVPLYRDPKTGSISTQFTMDYLEECGLVKMDFLGLKTLTLIENTVNLIRRRGLEFDIDAVPEDDPATYALLGEGRSKCVFQFESEGMQGILKRAKPTRIEDLIALNALYRPGPMENIDQFVESKNGKEPIRYPLPELKDVLEETYGVIVYQEQVMQIVRIIAGFSLGQADILRRAMGKKKIDVMEKMKVEFLEGAENNGFTKKQAEGIFDLLKPFAGYGFNKSHAAAYSVLAYKTAYLKANFATEFMAANLTNEINDTKKFAEYMAETRDMGIEILPPSVNLSDKYFGVVDGKIVYGLIGIKNVGAAAVDEVITVRGEGGPFSSFIDFLDRVDMRTVNRKVIETFIQTGVFDELQENRATLMTNLDVALEYAAKNKENRAFGQTSLFGDSPEEELEMLQLEEVPDWPNEERLAYEKENLGFYFSGHPLDAWRSVWKQTVTLNLAVLDQASENRPYSVLGILSGVRTILTKKGTNMAFATLEDFNGSVDLVFFAEAYEEYRDSLVDDAIVGVVGKIDRRRGRPQLVVDEIRPPDGLDEKEGKEVHIRIDPGEEEELYQFRAFLFEQSGGCHVYLHLGANGTEQVVRASSQLTVSSRREILDEISKWPQVSEVWKE